MSNKVVLNNQKKNLSNWLMIIPTWILAIFAIISLAITYRNIELVNRPFVSIENVYWRPENVWFISGFKIKNYGNKPAQEFMLRNVRVIILKLNKKILIEKLKLEKGEDVEQNQYFKEWFQDLRNKVYWETVNLLANYFYTHPDAKKTEVIDFLESWNATSFKNDKLKHNGKLLVSIIEVNNDMFEYFAKRSYLIYPNQENVGRSYAQQMGTGGMTGVEKGDNFLIVYWSIKYKGLLDGFLWFTPPTYSTNYVGYHLEPKTIIDPKGYPAYLLREFRSWDRTE